MNKRNKSTNYVTVHELNLFNHFCVHKRAPLCVYQMYFFLPYFETENSQAIRIFIMYTQKNLIVSLTEWYC